jgi:hypothetical protein
MKSINDRRSCTLFELLILAIFFISIASVLLLCLNHFSASIAVILGLIGVSAFFLFVNYKVELNIVQINLAIILLILVALLFRASPYLFIWGGQDEGVYVNMAAHYNSTGTTFAKDSVRENLSGDLQKSAYDEQNQYDINMVREGKYEGTHVPGVYISNSKTSLNVYQFYPLHPLWMAIFGKLFGKINLVYSIVFFSILSLIVLSSIAYELSHENKYVRYIALLLLAINPIYVFFSKFPVSEVVQLFFSSSGIYYFILYIKQIKENRQNKLYLFLSWCMFSCLFFTHINAFMYIPFFILIMAVNILYIEDKAINKSLCIYSLSIFLIFGLSILYGINYSYPYFYDIYRSSFGNVFGVHWKWSLIIAPFFVGAILLILSLFRSTVRKVIDKCIPYLNLILVFLITMCILLSLYKAYQLGYTDKYLGDLWVDKTFGLAEKGLYSVEHSNIYTLIQYISPIGFLGLLIYLFRHIREKNIVYTGALVYLLVFMFARLTMSFYTPYYYYGRYLFGEIVPFVILIISLFIGDCLKSNKNVIKYSGIGVLIIVCTYFSVFSIQQIGKSENSGLNAQLKRVASHVDKSDLLLLSKDIPIDMKTSFEYYYNINTAYCSNTGDFSLDSKTVMDKYNDTFFISDAPISRDDIQLIDNFNVKVYRYNMTETMPTNLETDNRDWNLYLYKISKSPGLKIDEKTPHTVGEYVRDSSGNYLQSKIGEEGFLIYGPYWNLSKGKYKVTFQINSDLGKTGEPNGTVDVFISKKDEPTTNSILASQNILSGDGKSWRMYTLEFEISSENSNDMLAEFRLDVNGNSNVKIKSVTLEPVN